ncbi:MAG: aminotransferase class V-fold PLP-dependent enzyme [Treponema sp.]|jgi:cysteine desulfurase family protein|nr:aminotransferase class V-fold PLP-dependent enzyme [Treponema sp.]
MIYLDNAATSWPKPERVYAAADRVLREESGNPGRSGHALSLAAGRRIEETRLCLARLFGAARPERIVFTLNTTDALNLAIKGILRPGDHVITGSMEHNSVARPLEALRARGVEYTKIPLCAVNGADPDAVKAAIRKNTRLAVFGHVSNVSGTVNPVAEIGAICRERGIPLLVDAAQSAGSAPIDVERMNIDLLAFPGHKGLLGPQGTGGLYITEGLVLSPLREGGTGSRSEELVQPEGLPGRYESGTQNTAGIAALGEGARFIMEEGVEKTEGREARLASRLIGGLRDIPGITLYGPPEGPRRKGVVSITLAGIDPAQASLILDNAFGIAVRAGLHCAPDGHRTLGTLDRGGTLRISVGFFNTDEDIDRCVEAIGAIAP